MLNLILLIHSIHFLNCSDRSYIFVALFYVGFLLTASPNSIYPAAVQ